MTTIAKNKWTFWGRMILIPFLVWLFVIPIQNALTKDFEIFKLLLLVFFLAFIGIIASFVVVGLLSKPITLTFGHYEGQFSTHSVLSGSTKYSVDDLKGFSKTKLWTSAKDYPGILLYLKDDSKIELTELNLQSLKPFVKFLNDAHVQYFGDETSWFPIRPMRFRYDN